METEASSVFSLQCVARGLTARLWITSWTSALASSCCRAMSSKAVAMRRCCGVRRERRPQRLVVSGKGYGGDEYTGGEHEVASEGGCGEKHEAALGACEERCDEEAQL